MTAGARGWRHREKAHRTNASLTKDLLQDTRHTYKKPVCVRGSCIGAVIPYEDTSCNETDFAVKHGCNGNIKFIVFLYVESLDDFTCFLIPSCA